MASTATYYFDASDSSITDSGSLYTNDSNAFDGNTATSADGVGIMGGSFSGQYLGAFGTNAPSSHASIILAVRLRNWGSVSSGSNPQAGVDIGGVQQGATSTSGANTWGAYQVITKADGSAWTWPDIAGLGVRMWPNTAGCVAPKHMRAEIEVTYSDAVYDYPIMVGMSAALTATALARFLPLTETNDTAVDTNDDDVGSYMMAPARIAPTWKMNIATAPGAGVTRNQYIRKGTTDSGTTFTIVDPATTGSDTTHYLTAFTDELVALKTVGSGGTPVASSGNNWRLQFQAERQQLWATSLANLSTTLVRYIGIQDSGGLGTTAAASTQYMPEDGGIKDWTVYLQNGVTGGGGYACDLFINGSSVVTLSITSQYAQDTGNTRTWTQGQPVYIQITPNVSTPTARSFASSGQYMSQDGSSTYAKRFILLSSNNSNLTTGTTNHNNWYGNGAWNATEALVQALGATCTLIGAYGILSADTGAAKTRTVTFRKGGADAATLFTFNNSGTTKTYSGSVSIANDDLINTKQVPSGTPTNATLKYGLVLEASQLANPSVSAVKLFPLLGVG